jgi:rhamnogalacturonan endolyase
MSRFPGKGSHLKYCVILTFAWMASGAMAADSPAVTAVENAASISMDNGIVALTIAKATGRLNSIRYQVNGQPIEMTDGNLGLIYDFDAGNASGSATQHANPHDPNLTKLLSSSGDSAEAVIGSGPAGVCPFETEMHIILRRGDAGFYLWVRYAHSAGDAAAILEQTRVVMRAHRGTDLFTHYIVNETHKGPFPSGPILDTVFDTTWLYQFDGIAHSKYETVNYVADDLVHGMAGHGVGMWLIQPSREYVNGGPLRQELTVHQDSPTMPSQNNILLWMLQGNHFGGPRISLEKGQVWSRFYGPAFIYFNQAGSIDALWADAKQKAALEEAKWPYAFVKHDDYPLDRGTVRGQVKLADGHSAQGAWVVLAPAGAKDWCMSADGYEFWTHADADGRFTLANVRPGQYALFVSGADQFEDFVRDGLSVSAGGTTDAGVLNWTPLTHGDRLWQIGVADHSSAEFANGNDFRHFDNHVRYIKAFPDDVTFTIGRSKESQDWNFAQWAWYSKQPYWSVLFDEPRQLSGKGTLTLGFVAFDDYRGLQATLNGQAIGEPIRFPKTGMAAYRCGRQDSQYHVAYVTFDAGLIHAGTNELRLALIGALPYADNKEMLPNAVGEVMYDAVRMEADAGAVGQ